MIYVKRIFTTILFFFVTSAFTGCRWSCTATYGDPANPPSIDFELPLGPKVKIEQHEPPLEEARQRAAGLWERAGVPGTRGEFPRGEENVVTQNSALIF